MKSIVVMFFFITLWPTSDAAQDGTASNAPPAWFLDEIAVLTAGTGRWVTNNSNYKNDLEPYDEYGTEWLVSFDGKTMTGRLFGMVDGEEVAGFWEFRQYWHPQKNIAVLEQFGWGGVVGIGTAWRDGETTKSEQTLFAADGTTSTVGHISSFPDRLTHVTDSFDIDGDIWTPRRVYTWTLMQE